jgi:hypothetical protein
LNPFRLNFPRRRKRLSNANVNIMTWINLNFVGNLRIRMNMIRNIMDYWHQLIKTKDMTERLVGFTTNNSRLKKLNSTIRNIMDNWHQLIKTKDMTERLVGLITSNSRLKKLDSLEKDAHRTSKPMKNFTVILHCKYKFGHVGGKAVSRQR